MLEKKHAQNHSVVNDDLMVFEGSFDNMQFPHCALILEDNPYVRGDFIVALI